MGKMSEIDKDKQTYDEYSQTHTAHRDDNPHDKLNPHELTMLEWWVYEGTSNFQFSDFLAELEYYMQKVWAYDERQKKDDLDTIYNSHSKFSWDEKKKEWIFKEEKTKAIKETVVEGVYSPITGKFIPKEKK